MSGQVPVAIALVLAGAACSAAERPVPAPWPDPSSPNAAATASATRVAPLEPWDLKAALDRAKVVAPLGPSQHLGASVDGEILADDAARAYAALAPGAELPPGATALERHDTAGVVFAMVKRNRGYDREGNDWEYLVITTTGRLEQRGKLSLCARCHAEAPHDHLFGGGRAR
jgi:hypothetical protein